MNKPFVYTLTVPPEVVDTFDHVNNVEYVRWVQDAAMRHSVAVGYGWEAYQRLGAAFVIRRHEIDYLHPARLGETLTVTTWIESHTRTSALRATKIAKATGEHILKARTRWVWVDLNTMRPRRIPDEIQNLFRGAPLSSALNDIKAIV
jgi:acyl-CoA thioester hydrolase